MAWLVGSLQLPYLVRNLEVFWVQASLSLLSWAASELLVCTSGGAYDSDRKMDDLKLLYRAYVADSLSSGRLEESKVKETYSTISTGLLVCHA